MGNCTVVVTGASGSCYGMRVIEQLVLADHAVSVARRVAYLVTGERNSLRDGTTLTS